MRLFRLLKTLSSFLSREQKKFFLRIQLWILMIGIVETVTLLFIWKLIDIVINTSIIHENEYLQIVYQWSGVPNEQYFIIGLALSFLLFLILGTFISIQGLRKSIYFANNLTASFCIKLHRYYLNQSWIYHTKHHSSYLIKQVLMETGRLSGGILLPFMHLNNKLFTVIALSFSLFLINPIIILITIVFFSIFYFGAYFFVKWKLYQNSIIISQTNQLKQQLLDESFGGIKDVLLLHKQSYFTEHFFRACNAGVAANSSIQIISQIPRYILEFLAVMIMVAVIIYTFSDSNHIKTLIPLLSAYAVAIFKLLPAFQQSYYHITTIKGNADVIRILKEDITNSNNTQQNTCRQTHSNESTSLKKQLSIRSLSFKYPNAKENALTNINIDINANQSIAFVGPSGSGKSTLIDILLGLITTYDGHITIDHIPLKDNHILSWQKNIGYVAQDVFLIDGTIAQNIAFGIEPEKINYSKVKEVIEQSQLGTLVASLPEGIYTTVGERGINLSGGQKQRIAIARALYQKANILILDEATNALDGLTEKLIIDTMKLFAHQKTIIMIAHRLNTIKHCDKIFLLNDGQIIDSGTYKELVANNVTFKSMAEVS